MLTKRGFSGEVYAVCFRVTAIPVVFKKMLNQTRRVDGVLYDVLCSRPIYVGGNVREGGSENTLNALIA